MGLRVSSSQTLAQGIIRAMRQTQGESNRALMQLSSGERFSTAGEDTAGFTISESLKSQVKGVRASRMNADNAISFVQVAEGSMNEQSNLLIRLKEIAIQAASDPMAANEREVLNEEFQGLLLEIDRIAKTTRYGSSQLLTGSGKKFEVQVGADSAKENIVRYSLDADTSADGLDISDLEVSDQDDAVDSIKDLDEALKKLSMARASFGALQARLQHAVDHLQSNEVELETARSKIADTDMADAVSRMTKAKIQTSFQVATLAQAHVGLESALKLLN